MTWSSRRITRCPTRLKNCSWLIGRRPVVSPPPANKKYQIDIRREIQLATAQLAHRQHDQLQRRAIDAQWLSMCRLHRRAGKSDRGGNRQLCHLADVTQASPPGWRNQPGRARPRASAAGAGIDAVPAGSPPPHRSPTWRPPTRHPARPGCQRRPTPSGPARNCRSSGRRRQPPRTNSLHAHTRTTEPMSSPHSANEATSSGCSWMSRCHASLTPLRSDAGSPSSAASNSLETFTPASARSSAACSRLCFHPALSRRKDSSRAPRTDKKKPRRSGALLRSKARLVASRRVGETLTSCRPCRPCHPCRACRRRRLLPSAARPPSLRWSATDRPPRSRSAGPDG